MKVTYSTYEDKTQKSANEKLGDIVDLNIADRMTVEVGGWGSLIKITTKPGYKVTLVTTKDGGTRILVGKDG
jgi:hypothetical protein